MSCHMQSVTDAGNGFTDSDSPEMRQYVLERPRLVLTALDLMEKLGPEKDFPSVTNQKEAAPHAS